MQIYLQHETKQKSIEGAIGVSFLHLAHPRNFQEPCLMDHASQVAF